MDSITHNIRPVALRKQFGGTRIFGQGSHRPPSTVFRQLSDAEDLHSVVNSPTRKAFYIWQNLCDGAPVPVAGASGNAGKSGQLVLLARSAAAHDDSGLWDSRLLRRRRL
jgi:hypothetical protein